MALPMLAAAVIAVLVLGYRLYGRWVARQFALDDGVVTPAHRLADGVDFVPTRPFYLFGQHFSAIAAAGPIVGPILACQQFGWLPCILWIAIGVVFIGAVHDVSTLVASVRHDARSVAEVVKANLGHRAWLAILTFIWVALIYVIVAFVDITASTFVTGDADVRGLDVRFNQGGAVALAALLYLGLALVMGVVDRLLRPPLWLQTAIFVPATLFVVWFGTQHSTWLTLDWRTWTIILLGYCAVASVTPMWLLMQPRGYLGGFVLYGALAVGVIGIFFGGYPIEQPAWSVGSLAGVGGMFPFLFVTIACGACSGFHGLVCSGTTSKQIDRESHCHPIGYGAMLLEAFVALIALATIMIVARADTAGQGPGAIYARGLGRFITILIGDSPEHRMIATTFGAMALSTFIFDTLDSATRLGRYVLQELAGTRSRASAVVATLVTCGLPLLFLGHRGTFQRFWTLFGTSNQLLASLSLLAISVWLHRAGKRPWFTLVPMALVMAVTVTSLVILVDDLFVASAGSSAWINGLVAAVLLALAALLVVAAVQALRDRAGLPRARVST
jgi:carbon starvation protein